MLYFDLRLLPPALRQLLIAEIVLVVILVVAACLWGAHSWRRMKRSQTAPARPPRARSKKRVRRR